jgi:lysophospholipase L1-like esterase
MWKAARNVAIPIALASTGLAFSFLALEVGLRLIGFNPMEAIAEGRSLILQPSDHPLRRFELTPNSSGFAWRTDVQVNSHGMRDRERSVERTGAPRIVVIGDSVTFGSGVAVGDRFTDRLEMLLGARLGAEVEVLNLGVGGYDTLQEVATLEDVGLRFEPDLVVVGYCVNDLGDNSPNLEYIQRLREADSRLYRLRVAQLLSTSIDRLRLMWLLRESNRDRYVAERHRGLIAPVSGDGELMALRDELREHMEASGKRDFMLSWYRSEVHLGRLAYALDRLARVADENGFEAVVAVLPYLGESASYDIVYRMIEHLAVARALGAVVLAPALSPAGLESLRSREEDPVHLNERGHHLVAEALAPIVSAKLAAIPPGRSGRPRAEALVPR